MAILLLSVFYICALVFNIFFQIAGRNSESQRGSIISERSVVDRSLRSEARSLGYRSLIYPSLFEAHLNYIAKKYNAYPLGGIPFQKTYYCNEGYGLIKYTSDRYGYRNDDNIYNSKIDVMLVGDSFVHGACVESEDTISYRLGLLGYRTINMGIAADNPLHYAARIKVFAEIVKPQYLVINFYANDNVDYLYNQNYWNFYFVEGADQKFLNKIRLNSVYSEALDYESSWYKDSLVEVSSQNSTSITLDFTLKALREFVTLVASRFFYELPPASKLAIDEAVTQCAKVGCEVIVSYIPASPFWDAAYSESEFTRGLSQYSATKGVDFINCNSFIDRNDLTNYAPQGPHLSIHGYQLAAQCIAQSLKHK